MPAVAAACGLDEDDVLELYRWFARTPRVVTAFSQGVNQSSSGTDKVNAIINVHLATGRIGKPGMGPFSLTGPAERDGRPRSRRPREPARGAHGLRARDTSTACGASGTRRASRRAPGLKAVDMFDALDAGRIKAMWIMSTNPVVSMPDAETRAPRARALRPSWSSRDCVRETDTTACAHVLLPAADLGREVRHGDELRAAHLAAARVPARARREPRGLVDRCRGRTPHGLRRRSSPIAASADVFREHARLSAFENDGTRAFDIGALREAQRRGVRRARAVPVAAAGD